MGFLTHAQRSKILQLKEKGEGPTEIVRILTEDEVMISHWSIMRFLKRFNERQSLENAPG